MQLQYYGTVTPTRLSGSLAKACVALTIAASAAGQPLLSDASLIIKVQDAEGSPIPGARVEISALTKSLSTAADGHAIVPAMPPGNVSVRATAEGFFPSQPLSIDIAAGESPQIIVTLQPRAIVNESVVVTATGTKYAVEESPIRTELLTQEFVDRQVKTTLAEVFQASISGVRMEMNCQNCGFMQIRMNGLDGPYTQILEDGLPSYSGVAAVYGLEQIPAAFLDQIEVVKGGNSALYGPGAVAGVVNLIRREPRENAFRIDLMSGWHRGRPEQQAGASMQLADMPGGFSGDFYFRALNRVAIDRDRDGFSDLGKRKLDSGGFGLYRRFLNSNARLSFNGVIASEFRRGGDQFDVAPHEAWMAEQADLRRATLSVGWNHTISPTTYYNLRASHAYLKRNTYYGTGMDPNAYGNTRNPLWIGDAQAGHQHGRHSLLAGYQVSWEHVKDVAPAYGRTYGGTFRNNGVYVQDEWRPTGKFSLIGGARLDKSNQVDRLIVSPRVGAKYAVGDGIVVRATWSTGFRAPAVFDEDLHITQVGGEGFLLQNDPGLREERSRSYMAGIDYGGTLRGRRFKFGANWFNTSLDDAFVLAEDMTPDSFRRLLRVNGPGAAVSGVDFDANLQATARLAFRSGFTVQRARWREPEPQFGTMRFFRTPDTFGFVGADWSLPWKIEWSGTVDYTGSMSVPHYAGWIPEDRLEQSQRFVVLNGVISRLFDVGEQSRMRLFVNVQNAGDNYQRDLDRGRFRDSGYVYGPSEMRRVVAGLTWEF